MLYLDYQVALGLEVQLIGFGRFDIGSRADKAQSISNVLDPVIGSGQKDCISSKQENLLASTALKFG